MIPFSPPRIYQEIIDGVEETLRSGWVTTGPKTRKFEEELVKYTGANNVLCVNSATAGLELMLRWFGVGLGDEVIVPAYTYCATANVVVHCGAKPVMVDVNKDFNIDLTKVKSAITDKTKVIIPVDIGGFPCDYDKLFEIVNDPEIKDLFKPSAEPQQKLGRIMIMADAAHSVGAVYNGKNSGTFADTTVFSFHAVKNITTCEGGAICLNYPAPLDDQALYNELRIRSLHGQTSDALAKQEKGKWEYDVIDAGFKCNMPDVLAVIGLIELSHYNAETLPKRRQIFTWYSQQLSRYAWAEIPLYDTENKHSSYHVYLLRIKGVNISQRNQLMQHMFDNDIAVNVHFKPLPLLSYYKNSGYRIEDYPVAYDNFSREISLPVYYDLTKEQAELVINTLVLGVEKLKLL